MILVDSDDGNSPASIEIEVRYPEGLSPVPPLPPQSRPKWPGTVKPVRNPVPWKEQSNYVTPTPLPYRPQWKIADWVENHPNFYMMEQIKKNRTGMMDYVREIHSKRKTDITELQKL